MKTILCILLFSALCLAGVPVGGGSGGMHDESGAPIGTYTANGFNLTTTVDGIGTASWVFDGNAYMRSDGDAQLVCEAEGWDQDGHPFAWHWVLWVANNQPPGGWSKAGEGDMY